MFLPLNFFRKLDSSGRYVIPAQIRKEFGVNSNEEIELFLIHDEGKYFLGFEVKPSNDYLDNLKRFSSIL